VNDDALFDKRASSFGTQAAEYAEHRPDYPIEGIRWALHGTTGEVLDLAAGTGKLTGGLLALGVEVTAVEPDPEMRAELTRHYPQVTTLAGTAERIPLPDASMDAVLVGQAFHWFDVPVALTEIARVLRPAGVVAALWNRDDTSVEWVAELGKVSRSWASQSVLRNHGGLPSHPAFEPFEHRDFPHAQLRTAESLTTTIGTHSHTIVISAAERAELLGRIHDFLASRPETANGEFELPIRTTVLRAKRAGGVWTDEQRRERGTSD
jgi:SAM-dependent methyltransferase